MFMGKPLYFDVAATDADAAQKAKHPNRGTARVQGAGKMPALRKAKWQRRIAIGAV
jgi:hypothetical protein